MAATDLYLIRKNQQWVKYSAVTALSITGTATADEIEVWSSEFRDVFSSSASVAPIATGAAYTAGITPSSISGPYAMGQAQFSNDDSSVPTLDTIVADDSVLSDEAAHEALRQTQLGRTCWKFDIGAAATPRYLFAFVMDGDIIANNPPETV